MSIHDILAARRDSGVHSRQDLEYLARGAASGEIPDYQLSAWLMAAYLNPLTDHETAWLTSAMAASGERMDLTGLPKPWVDKHSTGGVGDKTSIVLLPLLASCGLTIVKMSGRGLGITGGTVDKLASVPGFRLDLTPSELKAQADRIGLAITGQSPNLAPADKVFYSLRDATETVASIPLIVSSILSKKIAGGADIIVIDVKCGSGALMKDLRGARDLALSLQRAAKLCGLEIRLAITDMDQPLGRAVGNALEIIEAVQVLRGDTEGRFTDLCIRLAALTLFVAKVCDSESEGQDLALGKLHDRSALAKAKEWFSAQGAKIDLEAIDDELYCALVRKKVFYHGPAGWAKRVDAEVVGKVVISLGGGRSRKEDSINPAVGVEVHVEVGEQVENDQLLFTIHASTETDSVSAADSLARAVEIVARPAKPPPLLLDVV